MSADPSAQGDVKALIGRYQVIKRIGAGGMGAVYRAVHADLGREVALKVLPLQLATQPAMLERFRQEAQYAAKLRHEHIVTLYEFGEANGLHFLAMEFVEGSDLHEYIDQKGRLDPEEARQIAIQAAKALTLAHKHNIVHRDIKPSNFLLTQKDGRLLVKLTDFGLARNLEDTDFKVTRNGTTIGTIDYIAPEQARNSRAADIRSDIYSLGCTLHHMLTGSPPFSEGDTAERLLKHLEAEPPDVRQSNPKVPAGLVVVLKRMLAKKPEDRYQTPADLLKDLEHLPSAVTISPRDALEALAADEKPKSKRQPSAETQRHIAAQTTRPMGVPAEPAALPKLRYRTSKSERRIEPQKAPPRAGVRFPVVIEGWKPWALILGGIAIVILLGLVLALGTRP